MPAGHIIPPGSAQDFAQQQAALRAGQDEQKLRQGIMIMSPQLSRKTSSQNGLAAGTTDLTGDGPGGLLAVTIAAGTRRLIELTAYCVVQKHATKSALQLFITDSANTVINQDTVSVDGTTDDYNTLIVIAVDIPVQGSKTYKVRLFVNNGTADVVAGASNQCYLLAKDIGQSPA